MILSFYRSFSIQFFRMKLTRYLLQPGWVQGRQTPAQLVQLTVVKAVRIVLGGPGIASATPSTEAKRKMFSGPTWCGPRRTATSMCCSFAYRACLSYVASCLVLWFVYRLMIGPSSHPLSLVRKTCAMRFVKTATH